MNSKDKNMLTMNMKQIKQANKFLRIALFGLLFSLLFATVSTSQTKEQLRSEQEKLKMSGASEEEILEQLKASGLSESEIKKGIEQLTESGQFDDSDVQSTIEDTTDEDTTEYVDELAKEEEEKEEEILPITEEAPEIEEPLRPFGYEIFNLSPKSFEPLNAGPVDPNYTLGPGDEIVLTLWGDTEQYHKLVIDREGKILLPDVGQMVITGLTMQRAEAKILKRLAGAYSGLKPRSGSPSVFMDVSLGRLRSIRVFIVGEVVRPGGYTMRATSTSFNALYYAGGPNAQGSFRDIRILRNGKLFTSLDLYSYILYGNTKKDVRLRDGDTIFIPRRGRQVAIKGEVFRPALFELKTRDGLKNLIDIAGGLKPTASIDRLQIDRIVPFAERDGTSLERKIVDVDYRSILNGELKDFKLVDSDVISVFSIIDFKRNLVSISGTIMKPGIYEWTSNLRLSELIGEAGGILGDAFLDRAEIVRTLSDSSRVLLNVNLAGALEEDTLNNITLEKLDEVRIYSIRDMKNLPEVSIFGHVLRQGRYELLNNMTLYDLIFKAGGMLDDNFRKLTYLERADVIRVNEDGITKKTISVNLQNVLDKKVEDNLLLQNYDEVRIYDIWTVKRKRYVTIVGKVKEPDQFELTDKMTLRDLIIRAGGYTDDAYVYKAEIAKIDPYNLDENTLATIEIVDLPQDLSQSDDKNEYYLSEYDKITVRRHPFWQLHVSVSILGQVKFPGEYALRTQEEGIYDLVQRAGGLLSDPFLIGARLMRGNNRVVIDFKKVLKKRSPKHDLVLMPGDIIIIPKSPKIVEVSGSVNIPGLIKYVPGNKSMYYISRAGGFHVDADKGNARISRADGRVVNSKKRFWWDPKVNEGDEIIISLKEEKEPFDFSEFLTETSSIVASLATIAFVIVQSTK